MSEITLDDYKAMVGQEVGVSRWFEVPQGRINTFADVTEDHQFIHVDPERAKATPFGGTVAHGFLTMSLLAPMAFDAQPRLTGTAMSVNYGFDRVRLIGGGPRTKGDHGQDAGNRRDRGRRQAGPGGGLARPDPLRLTAFPRFRAAERPE
jgi:MaoC like domain